MLDLELLLRESWFSLLGSSLGSSLTFEKNILMYRSYRCEILILTSGKKGAASLSGFTGLADVLLV